MCDWFAVAVRSVVLSVLLVGATCANTEDVEVRVRAWMPDRVKVSHVFQYAVVCPPDRKGNPETAYLWIPAKASTIRGLVLAGDLMMESNFIVDPTIRAACREQSIGILYFSRGIPSNFKKGDDPKLAGALARLAGLSNHPELLTAPIMPIGHSAASPKMAVILNDAPERCFAALTYKGAQPIPTDKPLERVRGIPTLHVQDFVEEYKDRRETGSLGRMNVADVRAKDTQVLSGIIEDNGSKHAAWCFRLTPLIAEFIRASAELRIGPDGNIRAVPVEAGALIDRHFVAPRHETAPAAEYKGDPREAMWYPSLKMAQMVTDYNQVQLGKEPQYIAFVDPASGNPLPEKDAPQAMFVGADEFEVNAVFLSKTMNSALPQDSVTHADGPIQFAGHGRRLERVGANRFRLIYEPTAVRWFRLSAYNMGDSTHRFEEKIVTMNIGDVKNGIAQAISFPALGRLPASEFPVALAATSSSGLRVRYVVEYGPATVTENGDLTLTEVPTKASFPLSILVTAYQLGSHVDPLIKQAEPVRQTIEVDGPMKVTR